MSMFNKAFHLLWSMSQPFPPNASEPARTDRRQMLNLMFMLLLLGCSAPKVSLACFLKEVLEYLETCDKMFT